MSVLEVITHPNPILREKSQPVIKFDENFKQFIQDLFETMEAYNGIGLAAPQTGILQRVFVIGFENKKHVFVNPTLSHFSGHREMNEGCLSLPDLLVPVPRAFRLDVQAFDETGSPFTMTADDMLATIIQHEYDHLEGILIIDKNPPIAS